MIFCRDRAFFEVQDREESGKLRHFTAFRDAFCHPENLSLGRMPADLPEVLADMALGSPAVIALRTLATIVSRSERKDHQAASAGGFRDRGRVSESFQQARVDLCVAPDHCLGRLLVPSPALLRGRLPAGRYGRIRSPDERAERYNGCHRRPYAGHDQHHSHQHQCRQSAELFSVDDRTRCAVTMRSISVTRSLRPSKARTGDDHQGEFQFPISTFRLGHDFHRAGRPRLPPVLPQDRALELAWQPDRS